MSIVAQSKPTSDELEQGCGSFIISSRTQPIITVYSKLSRNVRIISSESPRYYTSNRIVASRVQFSRKELEPDNGIDDDDKEN